MSCEHVIWQNSDLDLDDWRDFLLEENPGITEEEMIGEMYDRNAYYFDDERMNLSHEFAIFDRILVVADLGFWDGRKSGYKILKSSCLADCLTGIGEWDEAKFYVDRKGEFRATAYHHDGTDCFKFRGISPYLSDKRLDNLLSGILCGCNFSDMLRRSTFRLGDLVGDVYGWEFPNRPGITKGV